MSPPAFSDIAKYTNDLIKKDFFHTSAGVLEVKLKTPNGVAVTARGTSPHDGPTTASIEARQCVSKGVVTTISSNTSKNLVAKAELDNITVQGVRSEISTNFHLDKGLTATKFAFFFRQPLVHSRAFIEYTPFGRAASALVDTVVGRDGLLIGGEAGYDMQSGTLTRYSAAIGYHTNMCTFALSTLNNMGIVQASYYQKVNPAVEAGIKAVYDLKSDSSVSFEFASKYKIDHLSFAKARINDRGIASLAYKTKVNQYFSFGLGASFNTQKPQQPDHKIGAVFSFEG